ncbi:MAG: hypothetical protein ACON4M_04810 [Crocinitomicaceae bacterium]
MTKKQVCFALLLLILPFANSNAQEFSKSDMHIPNQEKINPLVEDFYGKEQYQRLLEENPGLILYKHCLITYGYQVKDIGAKANLVKYPLLNEKKRKCKNSINDNLLCYDLSVKDVQQTFIINGSKALIIIPKDELLVIYNSLLRKF